MAHKKKQAVVIVHGIGEQRPMDTVREFVKTVWAKDHELQNARFWNKPSEVSNSLEQRRLTTDYAKIKGTENLTSRVDFYEYYWAHHTVGTGLQHLKDWLMALIFRSPMSYPKAILPIYLIVWTIIIASISYLVIGANQQQSDQPKGLMSILLDLSLPILGAFVIGLLINYLGDVARYVRATPSNIKVRQAIRQGGIALLESLSKTGNYDRIVLVGHSLGSVICYDILTQYWAHNNKFKDSEGKPLALSQDALSLIEKLEEINPQTHQKLYRTSQNALFHQLQKDCHSANQKMDTDHQPWLISDLVTLGSPLTYADFLLFDTPAQFELRKRDREYPTCPPIKESEHFYYGSEQHKYLHHSAVFAPVRWTNIYSPHFLLLGGDIISGQVSQAFNSPDAETPKGNDPLITPVLEIPVAGGSPGLFGRWLTHTSYWRWHQQYQQEGATPAHIIALRNALDLKQQSKAEPRAC